MAKNKKTAGESFVTQSQWAEGMEMIKGFFGKLVDEIRDVNHRLGNVEDSLETVKEDLREVKEDLGGVKKEVKTNSDSLVMLTKELQEVKSVEFTVYNHEGRITKLEKAR